MKKYILVCVLLIGLIYFLNQVFSGRLILPQTFSLGFINIHYYGLIMALAVLVSYFYALWSAEKFGFTKKQTEDLVVWIVPICFISARLYHVLSEWGYYQNNLSDIFKVWNGGLSIFGVIFGGALGLIILNKTLNLPPAVAFGDSQWRAGKSSFLNLYDWLAPAVLLGQIIGRFGNFFNYEAYGYPTNLPWKMFVPENFRPVEYINNSFFHPWFLYESVGNLILFIIIFFFVKRQKSINLPFNQAQNYLTGTLFFSYILWYNSLRFVLEYLRIDSIFSGTLRVNALIALVLAILGLIGLFWSKKKSINV